MQCWKRKTNSFLYQSAAEAFLCAPDVESSKNKPFITVIYG